MSTPDFLVEGEQPNPDSVLARLSQEAQEAIKAKALEWFGHDTELGGYSEDAVKELGKNAV